MPYIAQSSRTWLEEQGNPPGSPGELTYLLTQLIRRYLGKSPRFSDFAAVLGSLEATKLELYRRMVAPYEDQKRRENGEVYFGRLDPDVKAP